MAMRGNTSDRLVWIRVAAPVVGTVLLFLLAGYFYYLPSVHHALLQQKRIELRDLTDSVLGVLGAYQDLVDAGILDEHEARRRAARVISRMRFGPEGKDYFWINDLHPRMVMHPYRPDLEGRDLSGYTDPEGNRLFLDAVRESAESGAAFIEYHWQWKDDPNRIVPKLSHVRRFPPWGWIVGTGVYLQDVEAESAHQTRRLTYAGLAVFGLAVALAAFSILQGRQADVRLRIARDKSRLVFDQSFQLMALLDTQGNVLEVNKTAREPLGLQESEVLGRPFWETPWWSHDERQAELLRWTVSLAASGHGVCWRGCHPDGRGGLMFANCCAKPALDGGGKILGVIAEGQDVTDQIRAHQEREGSLRDLEARNAELERVAYVVSHDLRNPLVTIKGFLGVLGQAVEQRDRSRIDVAMRRIERAADRIVDLLGDLSALFRLDRPEEGRRRFDFGKLVRQVAGRYQSRLAEVGAVFELESEMPEIYGDQERLGDVLANLLENSLRFASPQRPLHMRLGVREDAEQYEFYFVDNGIGIRPAYLERIFNLFEQLAPDGKGTGVGLALVRRIVEQHEGRVWAESEGEETGTTIRFTLPLADVMEREATERRRRVEGVRERRSRKDA